MNKTARGYKHTPSKNKMPSKPFGIPKLKIQTWRRSWGLGVVMGVKDPVIKRIKEVEGGK